MFTSSLNGTAFDELTGFNAIVAVVDIEQFRFEPLTSVLFSLGVLEALDLFHDLCS